MQCWVQLGSNCASVVCTRLHGISRFRFPGMWLSVIGLLVSDVWKDRSGMTSEFQGILEEWHYIPDNCSHSTHHYEAFKFHMVLKTYCNNPFTMCLFEPSDKAVGCSESPDWFMFFEPLIVKIAHEKLLVSHRAPPQVADRGTLTRYGGYRRNKIPGVDQN